MNDVLLASGGWSPHWWFLFFPLTWLLVLALVFRFGIARGGCWRAGGRRGRDGAREILAQRYARGEIGDEEYRTRLERLRAEGAG